MTSILECERLILREMTLDDAGDLAEVLSDSQAMRFYSAPFDHEKVLQWIRWNLDSYRKHGFGLWAVVVKQTGECIGDCGITLQVIDGDTLPEIGYHIKPKHCGHGYATEAAGAVMRHGMLTLGLDRIVSYMNPGNLASRRVAEKIGMAFVKEFEKNGVPRALYAVQT